MELVPFKQKYISEILSWIKSESDMIQWAGSVFSWPLTQMQFRQHLKAAGLDPPRLYPFALEKQGKIIGYCEISDYRQRYKSAMLSRVIISPSNRKIGLGKFLVREAVKYAFDNLGLHRLGLGVFDFNDVAIRCYTRAGFVHEGTLRESVKVDDSYWNCHLMSILREEWKLQE